jgi:hypothetical protein
MNTYPWWVSSTGQGVAQRLISLSALIIPILSMFGISLAQGDVQTFINAIFIAVFAVWHLWAWARANFNKVNGLGKYAPQPKLPQ